MSGDTEATKADSDLQMNAYYYSFDRTGVVEIDRVLSAVAVAGKRFHHTEWWNDEDDGRPSCQERIQAAANEAAVEVERLRAECSRLDAQGQRILLEMADEIEPLRAALAHIVKCDQLSNLWSRSVAIEALRASAGTPQAEEPTP